MKTLKKIQKLAPYAYFLLIILVSSLVTFIDAGFTFLPTSIWAFTIIPLFIFWIIIPNKNWVMIRTYYPIFIVMIPLSVFFAIGYFIPPYAHFGFKDFILFGSLIFLFFTSVTIPWKKIHLRGIFHIMCILAFVLSLYGIYRYIAFPFDRLTGPFLIEGEMPQFFPNAFAFFLIMLIPLQTLYLLNQSTSKQLSFRKIYFYVSSVVIFSAFFLVFSRAALIGLFVISIFFIVLQLSRATKNEPYFRGKSIQALLMIFMICILFISTINWARSVNYDISTIDDYLNLDATENAISFFDRYEYMKGAILISSDYPLFGVGPDNFQFFYPQYQSGAFSADNPHNYLLRIISESGILAGLGSLAFFIILIIYYFRKNDEIEQKYYVGALGFALLATGIQGTLDYNINYVLNLVILSFITGLFLSRFPVSNKKFCTLCKVMVSIFVIVVVGSMSVVNIHEVLANQWQTKAKEALTQKEYLKAAEYYEKAAESRWFKEDLQIKSAKMYELLYENEGLTEEEMNEWILAAIKAVEFYPHNSESWNAAGKALCNGGESEKAIVVYEKALELDGINHLEYYLNLMECKWDQKSLTDDDIDLFKKMLAAYTDLLKGNEYLLLNSPNHIHADNMYELLLSEIRRDDEELRDLYVDFVNTHEKQTESIEEHIILGGQERT